MSLQTVTASDHYQSTGTYSKASLTQLHPARLRNVRPQRNTGRLSVPAAQLTQQPLSESSQCRMLQTTPVLRITHMQENPPVWQGPGSQWHPAETFLQNREVSCRTGYKAKKHRPTADPRRAEKSFWICYIWYIFRSCGGWGSLSSARFREANGYFRSRYWTVPQYTATLSMNSGPKVCRTNKTAVYHKLLYT